MKCEINKNYSGFYPILIKDGKFATGSDMKIADILQLELEEYINFIIQNKGFPDRNHYYFKTKEQCREFIENFIEPRLIMEELIK